LTLGVVCASALAVAPGALASSGDATYEQASWVHRAALRFVSAELARDGAGACAVLAAPLRRTLRTRTCAQRWDAKLARLTRTAAARARLRRLERAIPSARVTFHGDDAWIKLPVALMTGQNRFRWTENCWMLEA
jgi:hypothetical protein